MVHAPVGVMIPEVVIVPEGTVGALPLVEAEADGIGWRVSTVAHGNMSHLGERPGWYLEDNLRVGPGFGGRDDRAELD